MLFRAVFLIYDELWLLHLTTVTLLVSVPSMKCPVIIHFCSSGSSSLTLPRPLLALIDERSEIFPKGLRLSIEVVLAGKIPVKYFK